MSASQAFIPAELPARELSNWLTIQWYLGFVRSETGLTHRNNEKYKNFIVNLEKLIDKNIKEHSKDESIVAKMAWITNKIALVGALSLYLNLINLFIYLLQLFGKKRND